MAWVFANEERAENEAGMEEMAKLYDEKGRELYLPED